MNEITKQLLSMVSDYDDSKGYADAYSIRENGSCVERRSTEHIKIDSKTDNPGLVIHVAPGTKGERVSIPACVTHGDIDDVVYNDFYIGEGADVLIVAGCGVHVQTGEPARHNGIHRFFLGKNARVKYIEKHYGEGTGTGERILNPATEVTLDEGSYMEMETVQIKGVNSTIRTTRGKLAADAKLIIHEKIMTDGAQTAETDFEVDLDGENSSADVVSRSVARGTSHQLFKSKINGNNVCSGHTECDAIIMDHASVSAVPQLTANSTEASLIHEAAIGKIAGEQLIKLMTLGLTEEEAEAQIINGFLK